MTPENFQALALSWLAVISTVIGAAVFVILQNKDKIAAAVDVIRDLISRVDKHDDQAKMNTTTQVTDIKVAALKKIIPFILIPILFISGCEQLATLQAKPATQVAEKLAGQIIFSTLLSAAQTEANGGKINSAWGISAGLNSISTIVSNLSNDQATAVIVDTATTFAGDTSMKPIAQKLAQAYLSANPQTSADKTATVLAISSGVQKGTQQATASLP